MKCSFSANWSLRYLLQSLRCAGIIQGRVLFKTRVENFMVVSLKWVLVTQNCVVNHQNFYFTSQSHSFLNVREVACECNCTLRTMFNKGTPLMCEQYKRWNMSLVFLPENSVKWMLHNKQLGNFFCAFRNFWTWCIGFHRAQARILGSKARLEISVRKLGSKAQLDTTLESSPLFFSSQAAFWVWISR